MNNQEYNLNAERTLSYEFFCDDTDKILLHGAIGMVTEMGEILQAISEPRIDVVNLKEEIGDVLWYLSIFSREFNIEFEPQKYDTNVYGYIGIDNLFQDMMVNTTEVLDMFKKLAYYNRQLDPENLIELLNGIFLQTLMACEYLGTSVQEVREVNINKLSARFPEKFTIENANVRNLDKERMVLEGDNGTN
jgi:NTP pyrophosphatase (non-canonical NTP hydrolase)